MEAEPIIKPRLRRCAARHSLRPKTRHSGDLESRWSWLGRLPEAIEQFHEALRINPNDAETHDNLGLALLASGKAQESVPEFETALRLKPELQGAADNLRRAQSQLGSQNSNGSQRKSGERTRLGGALLFCSRLAVSRR